MSELETLQSELAELSNKHEARLKDFNNQIISINAEIVKEKSGYSIEYHNRRNRIRQLQSAGAT